MKKAFFEDSAMAMAKLIVESIYHGMEENEGVYADLMYSNGKGQHGWAHIFQNEHEHLTKAGYRVVLMVSGSWKYAVAYDPHSKTAIMILRQENFAIDLSNCRMVRCITFFRDFRLIKI